MIKGIARHMELKMMARKQAEEKANREQKAFLIEHYPKNLDGIKPDWLGALLKTEVSEFVSPLTSLPYR